MKKKFLLFHKKCLYRTTSLYIFIKFTLIFVVPMLLQTRVKILITIFFFLFLLFCSVKNYPYLLSNNFLNLFFIEKMFYQLENWIIFFLKNFLFFFINCSFFILKILCIFLTVAFFTVAERKILGAIHRRRGPNMVGVWGLLQPIADALKLFLKELIIPVKANRFIFLSAPAWILLLSVFGWVVIPFNAELEMESVFDITSVQIIDVFFYTTLYFQNYIDFFFIDLDNSLVFLLVLSSLNVYGIILSGWASNSKYAFLGSLRSSAQMISYEISLGLTVLPIIIFTNSFNFIDIVFLQKNTCYLLFPLLPCFFIFLISMLAETNRTPFDLPEAEAELVAGYNVEYSAITFAMFFLGEYSSMILMATFAVILFVGGWNTNLTFIFSFKVLIFCFFYVLIRATLPRFRYDQLMQLCWKIFLPISLAYFIFVISFFFFIINV